MEILFASEVGIIHLDDVAKRYGVSLEALKEVIKGQNNPSIAFVIPSIGIV